MAYSVKEILHTIQGEGANVGASAVFCRFAGCNLWSGLESDRVGAPCDFCDTDFVGTNGLGGGVYPDSERLAKAIGDTWAGGEGQRLVVLTGGEPLLQVDEALLTALRARSFKIAVETNGTIAVPAGVDWVCVSPKAGVPLAQLSGDEMKVVFPQGEMDLEPLSRLDFKHFFLQPMDGLQASRNLSLVVDYCLKNPKWRVSVQVHKILGLR